MTDRYKRLSEAALAIWPRLYEEADRTHKAMKPVEAHSLMVSIIRELVPEATDVEIETTIFAAGAKRIKELQTPENEKLLALMGQDVEAVEKFLEEQLGKE